VTDAVIRGRTLQRQGGRQNPEKAKERMVCGVTNWEAGSVGGCRAVVACYKENQCGGVQVRCV